MPSIKTRVAYQNIALAQAEVALTAAATAVASATDTLSDIEDGALDLSAITVGGQRFVNNAGNLELEV